VAVVSGMKFWNFGSGAIPIRVRRAHRHVKDVRIAEWPAEYLSRPRRTPGTLLIFCRLTRRATIGQSETFEQIKWQQNSGLA
jgi:hypothetical protein